MPESELLAAILSRNLDEVRRLALSRPELRELRGDDGLLPATHALYLHERRLAEALLPSDAALTAGEAAAFGREERLRQLLDEAPGGIGELSPDGFTPLHLACFSGGARIVQLFVDRGASLDTPSRHQTIRGVPPLGTAAFSRDRESARLLLEAGADPSACGEGGFTALHTAAANGDLELVGLLLEHGADPRLELADGRTPARLARDGGHSSCAELLET